MPGEIQALANLGVAAYDSGVTDADVYTAIAAAIWYDEYNTSGNSLQRDGRQRGRKRSPGSPATGLIAIDLAYAAANAT